MRLERIQPRQQLCVLLFGKRWLNTFQVERAVGLELATVHLMKVLESLLVNH